MGLRYRKCRRCREAFLPYASQTGISHLCHDCADDGKISRWMKLLKRVVREGD